MNNRFLICRCKTCSDLTFMALYDSIDEIESANKQLKTLRKEGRAPQIEEFERGSAAPEWCGCPRIPIERRQ